MCFAYICYVMLYIYTYVNIVVILISTCKVVQHVDERFRISVSVHCVSQLLYMHFCVSAHDIGFFIVLSGWSGELMFPSVGAVEYKACTDRLVSGGTLHNQAGFYGRPAHQQQVERSGT